MPGLIPLLLTPSSPLITRRASEPPNSSSSCDSFENSSSSLAFAPRPLSVPSPSSQHLPYSDAGWRKIISEVKRQHQCRRYRLCAAKCTEILDKAKNKSTVEPVYLIYLHFYAATSLEACAGPLPATLSGRTSLLRQAQTHFDRAVELVQDAQESTMNKFGAGSVSSSSRLSSYRHSPCESVSSQSWEWDSRRSSPTNSVCSLDDIGAPPPRGKQQKRAKKVVSFSLPQASAPSVDAAVLIRPDSPTLGFENDEFLDLGHAPKSPPSQPKASIVPDPAEDDNSSETFAMPSHTHRYCEHLAVLRAQLLSHRSSVDRLLSPPTSDALEVRGRRTSVGEPVDLQTRIERLRQNGWQRKRFDATRYEQLRDAVMAELVE